MRTDGTWKANTSSYDIPIDLTTPNDNILDLHYSIIGDKSIRAISFVEPYPFVVDYPGIYF